MYASDEMNQRLRLPDNYVKAIIKNFNNHLQILLKQRKINTSASK